MATAPQIQVRVNEIADLLCNGIEPGEILRKFTKKYKIGKDAVNKYIAQARTVAETRLKEAQKVREALLDDALREALTNGLKSDLELEMILCKIAGGEVQVQEWIKGEVVIRSVSPMEIIQATKTIFAKRGTNAPTKQVIDHNFDPTKTTITFE